MSSLDVAATTAATAATADRTVLGLGAELRALWDAQAQDLAAMLTAWPDRSGLAYHEAHARARRRLDAFVAVRRRLAAMQPQAGAETFSALDAYGRARVDAALRAALVTPQQQQPEAAATRLDEEARNPIPLAH